MLEPKSNVVAPEIQNLLVLMGKCMQAASIYGSDHPHAKAAISQAYQALGPALKTLGRININMVEGRLRIDGKTPEANSPLVRMIENKLNMMKITGFSLKRGMAASEFEKLLCLIILSKPGEFEKTLKSGSMQHIESSQMTYEAVDKNQTVMDKDKVKERMAAARSSYELDVGSDYAAKKTYHGATFDHASYGLSETHVQQILAFVKGGEGQGGPAVSSGLEKVASDADSLANIILEAASIRQSNPDAAQGESMADVILGCLRRTYEGLSQSSLMATEEGRSKVKNSLLLLEKTVMEKLRSFMGVPDPVIDAQIRAAIRDLSDRVDIDAVASQYMEYRTALEESEKKILNYIRLKGPQAFQGSVLEENLSPSEWNRLTIRGSSAGSKAGGGDGGGPSLPDGLGALAMVLEKFDALMRGESPNRSDVQKMVGDVEKTVEQVAADAERRIEQIGRTVKKKADVRKPSISANQLLAQLAEITQELLQPLTVINCALNMISGGYAGEVGSHMGELLKLATTSGDRLRGLMDKLIAIVGVPEELTPDFTKIYGKEGKVE